MNVLTVSCHPSDDSFHASVRDAVLDTIGPAGRHVDVYRDPTLEDIAWATDLVFVYPTWWSTAPAPMIDWIAAAFSEPRRQVVSITAITTHGSGRLVNTMEGHVGKRLLMLGLPSLCARKCRTLWVPLYNIDRSTHRDRARFVERAVRSVQRLRV